MYDSVASQMWNESERDRSRGDTMREKHESGSRMTRHTVHKNVIELLLRSYRAPILELTSEMKTHRHFFDSLHIERENKPTNLSS